MKNEKAKHTLGLTGKWELNKTGYVVDNSTGKEIKICSMYTAQGNLVAAAPELLAALELIQEAFVHKPGDIAGNKARTAPLKYCNAEFSAALNAVGAAIAKAKGE